MNKTLWLKNSTMKISRVMPWVVTNPVQEEIPFPVSLRELTENYAPISLKEMDAVALLNRTDTKFVMTNKQLLTALSVLQADYRILSVKGFRLNQYRTLYFDTANFDLYNLHINDRAERYKVRSREYMNSRTSFLEVKHKTRKGRTIKDRISTSEQVSKMSVDEQIWLNHVYPFESQALEPKLWNSFTRITLVNEAHGERVTLDSGLFFYFKGKTAHLDGIAIAEVKRDAESHTSPFLTQMREQKIRPQGFSKYCVGVAMLYKQVKKNPLKPKMLMIEKMSGRSLNYERI